MSNAYGGIVNISFIVVFLVIISGYLAFSVNYNKAFKVKNKIISSIEECQGMNECAKTKINNYMRSIGYSNTTNWTLDGFSCEAQKGYCWKKDPASTSSTETGEKYIYTVATAVNIDVPIINNILPSMKIFQISGVTSAIEE